MAIEEVIRYIDGELSAEEAMAFEQRLKSEVELQKSYREVLAAKKLSSNLIEAEIRGHLNAIERESVPDIAPKRGSLPKWLYLLFGLTLISIVLYFVQKNMEEKAEKARQESGLYAGNYEEPIWPIERGESDEISRAVSMHLSGQTNEAVKMLEKDALSMAKRYWLAEVLMHAGRYEAAKSVLVELRKEVETGKVEGIDVERLGYMEGVVKEIK